MKIFLIVVAALVIGIPLALLLAVVVLKWYLKRKLKGFGGSIEKAFAQIAAMAGASMPGMKISLTPAEQTPWHHPAEIAGAIDLLTGKGFVEVGRYLVDGSNAIIMGIYHDPEAHLTAVIYDTKQTPPKMDISASYDNGGRFVFYTNIKHDGLDKPPYTSYERLQDLPNDELLERAIAGLSEGRDPIDPDLLPDQIMRIYNREQLWRVNRGGYTEQEIVNTLTAAGEAVTQDTIDASREAMNQALANDLDEMLRERFLNTSSLSAGEWEAIEDRFLSIHQLLSAEDLLENLSLVYPTDVDDRVLDKAEKEIGKRLKAGEKPIDLFAAMAQEAPRLDELQKLGETDEPVQAVFYAHPPYEDDEDEDYD